MDNLEKIIADLEGAGYVAFKKEDFEAQKTAYLSENTPKIVEQFNKETFSTTAESLLSLAQSLGIDVKISSIEDLKNARSVLSKEFAKINEEYQNLKKVNSSSDDQKIKEINELRSKLEEFNSQKDLWEVEKVELQKKYERDYYSKLIENKVDDAINSVSKLLNLQNPLIAHAAQNIFSKFLQQYEIRFEPDITENKKNVLNIYERAKPDSSYLKTPTGQRISIEDLLKKELLQANVLQKEVYANSAKASNSTAEANALPSDIKSFADLSVYAQQKFGDDPKKFTFIKDHQHKFIKNK